MRFVANNIEAKYEVPLLVPGYKVSMLQSFLKQSFSAATIHTKYLIAWLEPTS